MKDEVIEKHYHSKNCRIRDQDQYVPNGEYYHANFKGTRRTKGPHAWLEMLCDDPQCKFLAVVSLGALSNLVATKLGFKLPGEVKR